MDFETAQKHLDAWLEANLKLAEAESYSFATPGGNHTVSRTDASKVLQQINYWRTVVNSLSARGGTQSKFSTAQFS